MVQLIHKIKTSVKNEKNSQYVAEVDRKIVFGRSRLTYF